MVSTTKGFGFGGGSVSKNVTDAVNKTYEELRQLIKEAYEEGVVNGKSGDFNDEASETFKETYVAKKLEAIKYPDI
tara:strand:- start:162 stop:389 length:228 start_codon:yes stop_codon:yes gene_type:complete